MKKWKTEGWQVKILFWVMLGVLVAVLVPLFVIAHYNFISVDDYTFAKNAMLVWNDTHSVFKVLWAQVQYAIECYNTWQGTYFCEWFVTSMIGIFGRDAYYVGTYLSLGGLVLAEGFTFMVLLVKGLGADKYRAGIITMGCICMQVLLTPVPVEAFYWFCGAAMYTFSHALLWLLVGILFFFAKKRELTKGKLISMEIAILLLCVAIGGGNYVTALTMFILHVLYAIGMFYKKHPRKRLALGNAIFYSIALIINIVAPGNQVRQQASGTEPISAIKSILLSLKEAAEYIAVKTIPPCVVLGLLFVPLMLHIIKKKNYRYPLPVLVSLLSFGVFAAQFTPTLYALQITGAGRVLNLYRFNFYVLLFGNELYWIGWLWRRFCERYHIESRGFEAKAPLSRQAETPISQTKDGQTRQAKVPMSQAKDVQLKETQTSFLLPGWLAGGVLLAMCLYLWGGSTLTTISAIRALRSGEAKQYYAQHQERLVVLEDASLKEVYLEPLAVMPYLLYFGDIVEDTEDWVNKAMADYFGKEKIGLYAD